ncbi:hypothetical protein WNZ14_19140 [Hoeflea sp. AS60]
MLQRPERAGRYLDLEADASYEKTREAGGTDEETARLGLGLKLRR